MLIANKSDKDDRQVDKARGEKVWSFFFLSGTTQNSAVKIGLQKERPCFICISYSTFQLAQELGIPFYETSAKESDNVEQVG